MTCSEMRDSLIHQRRCLFRAIAAASSHWVWNSLPKTVLGSDSVAFFKSRLKTIPLLPGFFFFLCSLTHCLAPAPLKLRPYGAIQICLLLLLLLFTFGCVRSRGMIKIRSITKYYKFSWNDLPPHQQSSHEAELHWTLNQYYYYYYYYCCCCCCCRYYFIFIFFTLARSSRGRLKITKS